LTGSVARGDARISPFSVSSFVKQKLKAQLNKLNPAALKRTVTKLQNSRKLFTTSVIRSNLKAPKSLA